jgi:hypothetical protein
MNEQLEEPPEFLKTMLKQLEEDFHNGILTEYGFNKKRANLLSPYIKPMTKVPRMNALDGAVMDQLTQKVDPATHR